MRRQLYEVCDCVIVICVLIYVYISKCNHQYTVKLISFNEYAISQTE
jgi:hypothetical protein